MKPGNQVFILPRQPAPDDKRQYSGFGYLLGFGQAYAAHYAELDRQAERRRREANKRRRRQARGRNAAAIAPAGTRRQGAPDVAAATCTIRTASRRPHNRYNPHLLVTRSARRALQPGEKRFIGIFQNPNPHTFNANP